MACLEDVLAVYARPYHAQQPVVCMDETSQQLIGEVQKPLPAKSGQPKRVEHEYVRHGVAQLFLEVEPLTGRSPVAAGETRTRKDWAHWIEGMLTTRYPDAERVVLILDNLNTHAIQSLDETFPPTRARAWAERLEIHCTPKHGSWLHMAEIELSVLSGPCLNRRLPDLETLRREVAAWEGQRNQRDANIDWQFTTAEARTKLKSLYPTL